MPIKKTFIPFSTIEFFQDDDQFKISLDSLILSHFPKLYRNMRILEIGTNNLCVPTILSKRQKDIYIDAVEIRHEAIEISKMNLNGASNINIIEGDINIVYKTLDNSQYDLILCNPPFFKMNQKNISKTESIANCRHEFSLKINDITLISKKLLKTGGILGIVHRVERLSEVINLMVENNIEPKTIQLFSPRKGEEPNIIYIEGVHGGKVGLKIMPIIHCHDSSSDYSHLIKEMFKIS